MELANNAGATGAIGAIASITRFDEIGLLVLPAISLAVTAITLVPFRSRFNTPESAIAEARSMLHTPDWAITA